MAEPYGMNLYTMDVTFNKQSDGNVLTTLAGTRNVIGKNLGKRKEMGWKATLGKRGSQEYSLVGEEMERKEIERKEAKGRETERKEMERRKVERKDDGWDEIVALAVTLDLARSGGRGPSSSSSSSLSSSSPLSSASSLSSLSSSSLAYASSNWEMALFSYRAQGKGRNGIKGDGDTLKDGKEGAVGANRKRKVMKKMEGEEIERKETEGKEEERKEMERKVLERKEILRKELERKEQEIVELEALVIIYNNMFKGCEEYEDMKRKALENIETERKEVERMRTEGIEMERKEVKREKMERKVKERKEKEGKELERKETERKEMVRKEMVRKEKEWKVMAKKRMEMEGKKELGKETLELLDREGMKKEGEGNREGNLGRRKSRKNKKMEGRMAMVGFPSVPGRVRDMFAALGAGWTERKEMEGKEMDGKEIERKESERKVTERKETERKEIDRKKVEMKEIEGKETKRKEQEMGKKEILELLDRKSGNLQDAEIEECLGSIMGATNHLEVRSEMSRDLHLVTMRNSDLVNQLQEAEREIAFLREHIKRMSFGLPSPSSSSSFPCKREDMRMAGVADSARSTALDVSTQREGNSGNWMVEKEQEGFWDGRKKETVEKELVGFRDGRKEGKGDYRMVGMELVGFRDGRKEGKGDVRLVGFRDGRNMVKKELVESWNGRKEGKGDKDGNKDGRINDGEEKVGPRIVPSREWRLVCGRRHRWRDPPLPPLPDIVLHKRCKVGATTVRPPLQCYRCWHLGHVQNMCHSTVDRRNTCYNCGRLGHRVNICRNATQCVVCHEAGQKATHRYGGPLCVTLVQQRSTYMGNVGRQ